MKFQHWKAFGVSLNNIALSKWTQVVSQMCDVAHGPLFYIQEGWNIKINEWKRC